MQLLFYMFSTLMSLEDRLRLKLKVKTMYGYNAGPPMAIPISHSTTVLCDILIMRYIHMYINMYMYMYVHVHCTSSCSDVVSLSLPLLCIALFIGGQVRIICTGIPYMCNHCISCTCHLTVIVYPFVVAGNLLSDSPSVFR